ncbi:26S proteasome non-ATPase regulatory subunit 11-like protein [Picochlorum sp. SENEW3]|nr:26S proteasome non-ATPase regulatory subunit 11-like protein [Picochlorum sp. SENEW3]
MEPLYEKACDLVATAQGHEDEKLTEAVSILTDLVLRHETEAAQSKSDSVIKMKEKCLDELVGALVKKRDANGLRTLLGELRGLFQEIPKAKTAKIVRGIIEGIDKIPNSTDILVQVCQEQAAWATSEKRTFLRQRIDIKLSSLYYSTKRYKDALDLLSTLISEVKKLDDKLLLVEIHVLESKIHQALRNLPKAKAALVAARTAANAVYVPPSLQADMDAQSGILHGEEKDFKTAYSYFYEAFEQLSSLDDPRSIRALKYMLLSKIMAGDVSDVGMIISSKAGLKYAGSEVDALKAVAKAYESRSLADFQNVLQSYQAELQDDPVVHSHLKSLYDALMEQNLMRIIEPYSRVDVAHVASKINLPVEDVEAKLSQMILDKKFYGTLDQGNQGTLEIYDEDAKDDLFPSALSTIDNMSKVVDSLFTRSMKIVS